MSKLAEIQERAVTLDARRREIEQRVAGLAERAIDAQEVGRAMAQFTDVWEVLLAPERAAGREGAHRPHRLRQGRTVS
jgi:hypothetical protein